MNYCKEGLHILVLQNKFSQHITKDVVKAHTKLQTTELLAVKS